MFLLASKLVLACSCGSYTPLAVVYENADSIVHVKIEDIHEANIAADTEKPEMAVSYVKAKIIKSIKGNILNKEIAIIPSMCGKTIYVESLETDHEYILPVITAKNNSSAIDHNDVDLDKYILPGCAHSGGELIKN